ncbi:hypothetical protein [Streptomyces sp. I4(2020)]|uniref:hypothetical protein n=1 Tax=Streptomyces sp. I4(2020) TaxID=2760981 RepID=UPI0018EE7A54|nr:hypothetical protein [Streptomyces sp. I4(2020)]
MPREDHSPGSGLRRGVTLEPPPVRPLRLGGADPDAQGVDVDVPAAEGGQFLRPHRAVGTEVRHESPPHPDRVGEASTWATVAIRRSAAFALPAPVVGTGRAGSARLVVQVDVLS